MKLDLNERESQVVATLVLRLAARLGEDVVGTILHEAGKGLLGARGEVVALAAKIEAIKVGEDVLEPVTMEGLTDLLGLVMAKSGDTIMGVDLSDVPSPEMLEKLTPEQREEVAQWAGECHLEASDNDVHPGPCPEPLRGMLREGHYYKNWRVG